MTIRQAIVYGIKKLSNSVEQKTEHKNTKKLISSPTPSLDVNCLLEHILQKSKTFLIAHSEFELSNTEEKYFEETLNKRLTGLPIAYITGHKEFYGLDFFVTPDVLIPKPDTEILVEKAIFLAKIALANNSCKEFKIADICTGSGCIAISVLKEILTANEISKEKKETVFMFASDISNTALKIAKKNAQNLLNFYKSNIEFFEGDLLTAIPTKNKFNMILSNPPYIPTKQVDELLKDGRSEPRLALDGDIDSAILQNNVNEKANKNFATISSVNNNEESPQTPNLSNNDGLAIIKRLIVQAYNRLLDNGVFLIETGEYNAEKTASIMREIGFSNVKTFTDLAGQLRVTQGIKQN